MKFSTVLSTALVAATGLAQDVACRVNGAQVAVVDLETGICNFPLPGSLPVNFRFGSFEDYLVDAYYATVGSKFFNDIPNAGRSIDIPALLLFGGSSIPLHHIHLFKSPASNSTAALRKRFNAQVLQARDDLSDFVKYVKEQEGEEISGLVFAVSDPDVSSSVSGTGATGSSTGATGSTTSAAGTVTKTNSETTIITVTSCSDNKCHETTVPATKGPVTTTVEGTETVYTTWCPVETVTKKTTTVVTITKCEKDVCHETTAPATWGPATTTVAGTETVYSTWCPVTETVTKHSTTVVTVTKCVDDVCHKTTAPATWGPVTTTVEGTETVYTTWCPVSEEDHTTTVFQTLYCTNNVCETVTQTGVKSVVSTTSAGTASTYTTVYPIEKSTSVYTTTGAEGTVSTVTTVYTTTVGVSSSPVAPGSKTGTAPVGTTTGTAAGTTTVGAVPGTASTGAPGVPGTASTVAPGVPGTTTTVAGESVATTLTSATGSSTATAVVTTPLVGAGVKAAGSLVALVAIPLAYLL